MKNTKTFPATTTESANIVMGAGRTVELLDTGHGHFLIVKISGLSTGRMVATYPMSIFLKECDFVRK